MKAVNGFEGLFVPVFPLEEQLNHVISRHKLLP